MFSKPLISFFLLIGLIANLVLASVLDIQKDTTIEKNKLHSYGSVCDFKDEPSDDQFLNMIEQAWKDMDALTKDLPNHQSPYAMIGLGIGNQVYFSSSVKSEKSKPIIYEVRGNKGGTGTFNDLQEMPAQYQTVTNALKTCSENSDPQHKSNGMCGELTSTMAWMIDHPDEDIDNEKPRVAAWCSNGYLPPCSGDADKPAQWGCSKWTAQMGYRVVEDNSDRKPGFPNPSESPQHVGLDKCTIITPKKKAPKPPKGKGGKRGQGAS